MNKNKNKWLIYWLISFSFGFGGQQKAIKRKRTKQIDKRTTNIKWAPPFQHCFCLVLVPNAFKVISPKSTNKRECKRVRACLLLGAYFVCFRDWFPSAVRILLILFLFFFWALLWSWLLFSVSFLWTYTSIEVATVTIRKKLLSHTQPELFNLCMFSLNSVTLSSSPVKKISSNCTVQHFNWTNQKRTKWGNEKVNILSGPDFTHSTQNLNFLKWLWFWGGKDAHVGDGDGGGEGVSCGSLK